MLIGTPMTWIARRLQRDPRTISRWKVDPDFALYLEMRDQDRMEAMAQAFESAIAYGPKALLEIAQDPDHKQRATAGGKLMDWLGKRLQVGVPDHGDAGGEGEIVDVSDAPASEARSADGDAPSGDPSPDVAEAEEGMAES